MTDMIDGPGRYATRECGEAVVLEIFNGDAFGRARCSNEVWVACQWRVDNGFAYRDIFAGFSIVGPYVEPRKPLEGWVNVYPDDAGGPVGLYDKIKEAERFARFDRIACVYVRETEPPK